MNSQIISLICKTCSCDPIQAREHLDSEVLNLKEIRQAEDLRYSDLELACQNLGLDHDYVQYFIEKMV